MRALTRFSRFLAAGSVLATVAALSVATAQAQVTAYNSLAAFQAASGPTTNETFTSSAPFNTTGAFGPNAYTGFSLTGNGNGNNIGIHTGVVASSGTNTPIPATFLGQNFFSFGNLAGGIINPLTFNFSQPTIAFGFDYFNTDQTDQYRLDFFSGATNVGTFTNPPFGFAGTTTAATGFVGYTSTVNLTSVTLTNVTPGGYISDEGFDNVRVSSVISAVGPEPGSLAMMFVSGGPLGLTALGIARRRRRNAALKA